jgi:hypothetical protein
MTQSRERLGGAALAVVRQWRPARKGREWSAEVFGEHMTRAGCPMGRGVIANIEAGRRRSLWLDEWLTAAYVLDVAPLALLAPDGDEFHMNPAASAMTADEARTWITTGELPDRPRHRIRRGTAAARAAAGGAKVVESLADRVAALEAKIGGE